jgi:hypothetical protein
LTARRTRRPLRRIFGCGRGWGHLAGIDSWKVTLDSYVSDTLNLDTYGQVMDELDHAPRLAAVDAIMQARSGPPRERPGVTVSSA